MAATLGTEAKLVPGSAKTDPVSAAESAPIIESWTSPNLSTCAAPIAA